MKIAIVLMLACVVEVKPLRVYIYDSIPNSKHFGWDLNKFIYGLFENSHVRTWNRDEADYFYIPHSMPFQNNSHVLETFRWIQMNEISFNRSFETQKANHIMVMPCDHGPSDCAWERPLCYNHKDQLDLATNPSSPFRIVILLSPFGGLKTTHSKCCGIFCIERWKDIVIPPLIRGSWGLDEKPRILTKKRYRLYFAGKVGDNAISVRKLVLTTFQNASTEDLIVDSDIQTVDNAEMMSQSTFCFDPNGWDAGWNFRSLPSILLGCIPIVVKSVEHPFAYTYEEHPSISWPNFSIVISSKNELMDLERRISKLETNHLVKNGQKIIKRFLWDGDAFETLLEILQNRIIHSNRTTA